MPSCSLVFQDIGSITPLALKLKAGIAVDLGEEVNLPRTYI
jgi:hypothetical protein